MPRTGRSGRGAYCTSGAGAAPSIFLPAAQISAPQTAQRTVCSVFTVCAEPQDKQMTLI
jgi:hypothetical protein